jgi:hypothetical protein
VESLRGGVGPGRRAFEAKISLAAERWALDTRPALTVGHGRGDSDRIQLQSPHSSVRSASAGGRPGAVGRPWAPGRTRPPSEPKRARSRMPDRAHRPIMMTRIRREPLDPCNAPAARSRTSSHHSDSDTLRASGVWIRITPPQHDRAPRDIVPSRPGASLRPPADSGAGPGPEASLSPAQGPAERHEATRRPAAGCLSRERHDTWAARTSRRRRDAERRRRDRCDDGTAAAGRRGAALLGPGGEGGQAGVCVSGRWTLKRRRHSREGGRYCCCATVSVLLSPCVHHRHEGATHISRRGPFEERGRLFDPVPNPARKRCDDPVP